MKSKIFFTLISLAFAFAILALSVVKASAQTGSANLLEREESQESAPEAAEEATDEGEMLITAQEQTKEPVDYYLAYPGILPDHFLYPIKMIRDRVWLFLTTNKKDKIELLVLYADKRLGASKALIEGGKEDLGISTLSKAEKYLEKALAELDSLDDQELIEKVYKSSLKHEEVMLDLKAKASSSNKDILDENLSYSRRVQEKLLPLLKE